MDASVQSILLEKSLSPLERNMLLVMYARMDKLNWAHMSIRELTDELGSHPRTIRSTLNSLESRGYILRDKKIPNTYRPYPHNVQYGIDQEDGEHYMILTVEQAVLVRAACAAQEAEIIILADDAERRKDRAKRQALLQRMDEYVDLQKRLTTFINHNTANNQKPPKPMKIKKDKKPISAPL